MQIRDIFILVNTPNLILIPGLGDRKWLYQLVCPLWRARGFRPHVFTFGWEDPTSNYNDKQNRLNNYIRNLNGDVYIIGASAGGVAALSALVVDDGKIKGIATIATPYVYRQRLKNETLARAISELASNLPGMQAKFTRITSFYSIHDQVVPPTDSRLDNHCIKQSNNSKFANINYQQLPTFGHGLTVAAGLTVFSKQIAINLTSPPQ
jgi:hypothetical protein